jgi:hypothetical protein
LFRTPEPIPAGQTFSGYFVDELDDYGYRTWAPDGATATGWTGFDRDLVEEIAE